jgi:hypothetical protein
MTDDTQTVIDLTKITEDDLEKVRQRNSQKLTAIRQQGANLDLSGVAARRLDTLLDIMLTKEQRIQFEYAFETNMTEILDSALTQLRMASLTQGLDKPSQKLLLPGS